MKTPSYLASPDYHDVFYEQPLVCIWKFHSLEGAVQSCDVWFEPFRAFASLIGSKTKMWPINFILFENIIINDLASQKCVMSKMNGNVKVEV